MIFLHDNGRPKGKSIYNNFKLKIMSEAHPGFKAVQSKIAAKEGISKEKAGAILAVSSRKASSKAKKSNPRLLRVKTKK